MWISVMLGHNFLFSEAFFCLNVRFSVEKAKICFRVSTKIPLSLSRYDQFIIDWQERV